MKNKDDVEFVESGNLQIENKQYTIIKLKNTEYVAGFLTQFIVVPTKSLPKQMEANLI